MSLECLRQGGTGPCHAVVKITYPRSTCFGIIKTSLLVLEGLIGPADSRNIINCSIFLVLLRYRAIDQRGSAAPSGVLAVLGGSKRCFFGVRRNLLRRNQLRHRINNNNPVVTSPDTSQARRNTDR